MIRTHICLLLRYRSGDVVSFKDNLISYESLRLAGRESELYINKAGIRVSHQTVDEIVSSVNASIFMYQLIEKSKNNIELRYTTLDSKPLSLSDKESLVKSLAAMLEVSISTQHSLSISPGYSGKFPWFIRKEI